MASLSDLLSSQYHSPGSAGSSEKQDPLSVLIQGQGSAGNAMSGDTFNEPFTLISSTAESLGSTAAGHASSKTFLGHISAGKDWIASKHSKVQPWSEFFNPRHISRPSGAGEVTSRILGNLQRFQTNYLFVFLGLLIYCM